MFNFIYLLLEIIKLEKLLKSKSRFEIASRRREKKGK